MDYFDKLDAVGCITLSGKKQSDWYIQRAKDAMDSGALVYAGKYSEPDYELILSQGCDLAVENTMIYHSPAVLEQLERLGIPVLVETSSYETQPMGRMEWIKLYAALLDKETRPRRCLMRRWTAWRTYWSSSPPARLWRFSTSPAAAL